MPLADVKYSTR